ncbi:hypothetical protein chiPu_0030847, partial [Chiloscyllium punctatum]|nr:hypothetical protein [Chiloscyllium punctatum]
PGITPLAREERPLRQSEPAASRDIPGEVRRALRDRTNGSDLHRDARRRAASSQAAGSPGYGLTQSSSSLGRSDQNTLHPPAPG